MLALHALRSVHDNTAPSQASEAAAKNLISSIDVPRRIEQIQGAD